MMHLRVFPNPAEDILYIESNKQILEIEIYNSMGKLVYQQVVRSVYHVPVELSNLLSGLYIARIQLQGQMITAKFIIKK